VTAILGVGDGTTTWLATDGRNSYGHTALSDRNKRPVRKVLSTGEELGAVVAGYALTGRMLASWEPPEIGPEQSADEVLGDLGEDFGQYVMGEENLWRRVVDDEDPGAHGSSVIFAFRGRVGVIDSRFNMTLDERNRAAEGCAGLAALTAAMALHDQGAPWPEALAQGLAYAADVDVHVGPPFTVLTVTASGDAQKAKAG
jgi:ATP-dependent protease HslVU (ClpYQ) peptidase subunit